MPRYDLIISGVNFDPTVPPDAVSRTGGGREVKEKVSITGVVLRSLGHRTARRIRIASPGPEWVLRADQVAFLQALEASETPFSVTLGAGYEVSGTFTGCLIAGDAIFEPKRDPAYSNYDFELSLEQEAP